MSQQIDLSILSILIAASSSAHGIVIRTNDPIACRAELYKTRKMVEDPALQDLQIRVSPDDSEHEVWIIRRNTVVTVSLTESSIAQNNG